MRRVRISTTQESMRKSVSLSNVGLPSDTDDGADKLVKLMASCEKYLDDNVSYGPVDVDAAINISTEDDDLPFEPKDEAPLEPNDEYPTTLPRASPRHKGIMPRMRLLFDRAHSCEPDLSPIRRKVQSEPDTGDTRQSPLLNAKSDGPESSVPSCMAMSVQHKRYSSPIASGEEWSVSGDEDVETGGDGSMTSTGTTEKTLVQRRGFVKKCVTKAKSLVGSRLHHHPPN